MQAWVKVLCTFGGWKSQASTNSEESGESEGEQPEVAEGNDAEDRHEWKKDKINEIELSADNTDEEADNYEKL